MIDPRTQYLLYQERQNELMRQIERNLAAKERGELSEPARPWYARTVEWVSKQIFSHLLVKRQSIAEKNPC